MQQYFTAACFCKIKAPPFICRKSLARSSAIVFSLHTVCHLAVTGGYIITVGGGS